MQNEHRLPERLKKLTVRSKAIKEGILTHQVDEGSPCLKCGDKCKGFSLHFWRKTCMNCLCPRENHQISTTESKVVHVGKLLFSGDDDSPSSSPYIARRTSSESITPPASPANMRKPGNYAWIPKDTTATMVKKYMAALPQKKCPVKETPGEKYRQYQYARQLPAHDMDINYCNKLSIAEQEEFAVFSRHRREKALGRGILKEAIQGGHNCSGCFQPVGSGEVIVRASRAGPEDFWHPACFVCLTCKELLVDLIYFFHEGKLYCGRHHAEALLPRCAACDEIIFCGEYTVAENKNWHLPHFCCLKDDKPLGGNRYMMHEDQPFCIHCYDVEHSPKCQETTLQDTYEELVKRISMSLESTILETIKNCKRVISVDDARLTHGDFNWHGTPHCFKCTTCSKPLVDQSFLPKGSSIFCSKQCFKVAKSSGKYT